MYIKVNSSNKLSIEWTLEVVTFVRVYCRCVVVLYNPRKNKQSFIFNQARKAITCVNFSCDGKFLVTGEVGFVAFCYWFN
jgi:hypothetical protein